MVRPVGGLNLVGATHASLPDLTGDAHPDLLNLARHSAVDHDGLVINHAGLENVTADQHHAQDHASRHAGADDPLFDGVAALTDNMGASAPDGTLANIVDPVLASGIDTINRATSNTNLASFRAAVEDALAELAAKIEEIRVAGGGV